MPSTFLSSGDLLADRRYAYARGFASDGDHAAARDLFEQTLERAPGWLPARVGLADTLIALGDRSAAAAVLQALLPDDPDGLFGTALKLAALGLSPAPDSPSEAYIRGLFDDYADRFEAALVNTLGYRVPWLLGAHLETLRPAREDRPTFSRALDLGCGTGLMGEVLGARAGRLVGVDLSPEMVEKAAAKAIYHDLVVADAVAFLRKTEAVFDLVTAADVFVYVGTLDEIFAALVPRLAPGGIFAFSVERAEAGDVLLRDSLRYAHGEDYLHRLAAAAGLVPRLAARETLRLDRGAPIEGIVMLLEKPADPPSDDPPGHPEPSA